MYILTDFIYICVYFFGSSENLMLKRSLLRFIYIKSVHCIQKLEGTKSHSMKTNIWVWRIMNSKMQLKFPMKCWQFNQLSWPSLHNFECRYAKSPIFSSKISIYFTWHVRLTTINLLSFAWKLICSTINFIYIILENYIGVDLYCNHNNVINMGCILNFIQLIFCVFRLKRTLQLCQTLMNFIANPF